MLKDIKIEEPARAYLYFTSYPIAYKSQLSDDKLKVIITLNSTSVADTARTRQGLGAIKEVYVQSVKKNLSIFATLAEQQGYTAVQLPYSKAILLETFSWNKLSKGEDSYRTAMLAFEDNIFDVAKREFLSATMEQEPYSAMYLGMIFLGEGKINSAIKYLEFADNKGVDIPDLYAALSQAYSIKGLSELSDKFAEKFKNIASVAVLPTIPIASIIETDSTCTEPIAHLKFSKLESDSSQAAAVDTSELNKRFEAVFSDTAKKSKDLIPGIYNEILTYIGGAIGGIILLILYFYLRWRNKQIAIEKEIESKKDKVAKTKPSKSKPQKPQDAAAKLMASKAYASSKTEKSTEKPAATEQSSKKSDAQKAEAEKQQSIENLLQTIRAVAEEKLEEEKLGKEAKIDDDEELPKPKPVSAKLEIAMNLANEQRKIKQRNIDSLNQGIEFDASKLNEVAKKLGIEKGSLETKKAIEEIAKDDKSLKKLQEKFFKK